MPSLSVRDFWPGTCRPEGSRELPGIRGTLAYLGIEFDNWFSEESLYRWGRVDSALARLRERLAVLYDGRARLNVETATGHGFTATLVVPQESDRETVAPIGVEARGARR